MDTCPLCRQCSRFECVTNVTVPDDNCPICIQPLNTLGSLGTYQECGHFMCTICHDDKVEYSRTRCQEFDINNDNIIIYINYTINNRINIQNNRYTIM